MFSGFKRLIGNITIEVKDNIVFLEGVPADVIAKDITRMWGTSKIENNIFYRIDKNSFSFFDFFSVDVYYAMGALIDSKNARTNKRTLSKIRELLIEKTWVGNRDKVFPSILDQSALNEFHLTPTPFQVDIFNAYDNKKQANELNGFLLAAAAGSGKTIASLMLATMRRAKKIIVVCPENALNTVWETTVKTAFKNPPTYWVNKSNVEFTGKEQILIFNYASLNRLKEFLSKIHKEDVVVILDESHNFNELKSLRTELFLEITKELGSTDVFWLSGTPIKALAVEAISLIRCIDPKFDAECEARFKKIFGVSTQRASDILNHRLQGLMHVVEKKELGLIPPEFISLKVTVPNPNDFTLDTVTRKMREFTAERLAYYKTRESSDKKIFYDCLSEHEAKLSRSEKEEFNKYKNFLSYVIRCNGDARFCKDEMAFCNRYEARALIPSLSETSKKGFKEVKAIVKYVKLKVQGECLGRIVGKIRMQACLAMAENIDYVPILESTQKKTVMFTSFTEVIEKLDAKLKEEGLEPALVYGKTNANLAKIVKEFETNENVNPLIATYPSLSTAVPLIMANVCVLLNAPWRDYILQQTVSRISRLGQTEPTFVYTAILDTGDKPNIADRALDILKWSQQQVKAITGVVSPFEIGDDLDEFGVSMESIDPQTHYELSLEQFDLVKKKKVEPKFMGWK